MSFKNIASIFWKSHTRHVFKEFNRGDIPSKLTVVVGDSCFLEEKTLLIQSCDYFRALYRSGMKECYQEKIQLHCLQARGFVIALAVLRGDRPILDADDIVEAIECASFLQISPLTKYLSDIINSDNCLLVCHTASTYGLMELYYKAAQFVRDTYNDLALELRKTLPTELVSYIESLTPSTFIAVGAHVTCADEKTIHAASRTVCYLDEIANRWEVLTDLPLAASTSLAGVTVLDNMLYIVGGVHGVRKEVVDVSFCFDVAKNTWNEIASPNQLRYNFSLIGLDGKLYAIGGEYNRVAMSSVESYNVDKNTWSLLLIYLDLEQELRAPKL
ncbi:hypothetical protein WMY93_023263 [Mugilogobius chulae]|uniref:BTB domain-containing protein n=1 Tax=Mugilogobius chulae TaxID=88201 RepID=A0AAW0NEV1_9GOBI